MRSFSDEIVSSSDLKPMKVVIGLVVFDITLNIFEILNSIFHWV